MGPEPSHIQRGALTNAILTTLAATGKPVGDAERPRGGVAGWIGEPNEDGTNFVPYVVLTPMATSSPTGSFADPQSEWIFPYAMSSFGVSRKQCEWMADLARDAIQEIVGDAIVMDSVTNPYERVVQQVMVRQIGAVTRVPEVEPPYYGQTDIVDLWTSR